MFLYLSVLTKKKKKIYIHDVSIVLYNVILGIRTHAFTLKRDLASDIPPTNLQTDESDANMVSLQPVNNYTDTDITIEPILSPSKLLVDKTSKSKHLRNAKSKKQVAKKNRRQRNEKQSRGQINLEHNNENSISHSNVTRQVQIHSEATIANNKSFEGDNLLSTNYYNAETIITEKAGQKEKYIAI